ncbi:hypothetical protein MP228_009595 [Amoeboaphelidium protococcarum]|nr:hypothetical protein MP228_009595 [Amoeboaphelidium protococcarum]
MSVQVLYFAALKDLTRPQSDGKDVVELNVLETSTLGKLVQYLVDVKYTDRNGTALQIYENGESIPSFCIQLKENDEIAFIMPVSGG